MSATLSINDVQMYEFWSGVTNLAQFTARLSEPSDQAVTVNYTTVKGTAGTNDYVSVSGTLTFAPGVTTQYVHVEINGDDRVEADETFQVHLSGAVNGEILDALGIGTILNDDSPNDGSHSDCNGAKKSRTKECQ